MLGLAATEEARTQIRTLRNVNPELYGAVSDRIKDVRKDPGGPNAGRTFLPEDGRIARLATYYDFRRSVDLSLVWLIEEDAEGALMNVVWAAPFDDA